jgi:DNA modification methylase
MLLNQKGEQKGEKTMAALEIVYLSPHDLKPYEGNTRKHAPEDIDQIKASIAADGFNDPIGIWGKQNLIVEGHGRQIAAIEMGLETVPCIRLDHLTDTQRRDYAIRHNRTAELSGWDFAKLEEEIAALEIEGVDLSGLKFEFDALADDVSETAGVVEDEVPESPEEPKSKHGDIYQLGRHRLMCGDSTSEGDVETLLNGQRMNMVYTDPPYGMNLDTDFSSMKNHLDFAQEKGFVGGKKYDAGIVDEFSPKMVDAVLRINADEVFMWGADYYAELLPNRNDGAWIVWDKRANGNGDDDEDYQSDKMYGSCFELCWSKRKHKRDIARVKWAGVFGTEQEPEHKRFHPTQKPVKLSSWFIARFSKEGETVLDLFGGSGSTLIACEQLGRTCYMMELDPHYCDVIIQRWENLTGEKAVLLNDAA